MTDPAQRLETALGDRSAMERELGAGGMPPVYFAREERAAGVEGHEAAG